MVDIPLSPSGAVATAMAAERGKRTGVVLAERGTVPVRDGMEDVDNFWKGAHSPKDTAKNPSAEEENQQQKKKKVGRPRKQKPRFSVDGQASVDDEEKAASKIKHKTRLNKQGGTHWTPSDMSRVSTAPPSPASAVAQQEQDPTISPLEEPTPYSPPEEVRASPEDDEEEEEAVLQQSRKSPAADSRPGTNDEPNDDEFPMDDDADDMIPPPPPEEALDFSVGDDGPETQNDVEFPDNVDDDEDHDNEGDGYAMVHDPETPESVRQERIQRETRERKKKTKRKNRDTTETPRQPAKRKRAKKQVTYESPPGYPAGNREYETIPVSDLKEESPEDKSLRRSKRSKVPPLEFWRNERPVYEPNNEGGVLGEAMGNMPVVAAYSKAQPTPYKKREVTHVASKKNNRKASRASAEDDADVPFDSRKLRKKCKIIDGEEADVWDELAEDATRLKVISYAENMVAADLPLPASRKKSEGRIVGRAAQAFNVPTDDSDMYVGYIMGNLVLPPGGIKDTESAGSCSLSFTICQAQPKSIEVAFGDPNEPEGKLNQKTAQRFLLGAGDMFRVLPGNSYRLVNHSKNTDCLVSWTIIRPRRNVPQDDS